MRALRSFQVCDGRPLSTRTIVMHSSTGQTMLHRVAADAVFLVDLQGCRPVVDLPVDALVRRVLAGDIAAVAVDARLRIDLGDDL